MLPAVSRKRPFLPILTQNRYYGTVMFAVPGFTPRVHAADLCYGDSSNPARNLCLARNGEQQLVIFSAMQGKIEIGASGDRDVAFSNCGVEFAFGTDMGQIYRE